MVRCRVTRVPKAAVLSINTRASLTAVSMLILQMSQNYLFGTWALFQCGDHICRYKICHYKDKTVLRPLHKVTHTINSWRPSDICVSKLTTIGSDIGLSPGRRQAIIQTNAGILLIGPLETYLSEILIKIHAFSSDFHSRKCAWKCHLKNGAHLVSASMC